MMMEVYGTDLVEEMLTLCDYNGIVDSECEAHKKSQTIAHITI